MRSIGLGLGILLASTAAAADPQPYDLGVRVGGYGFHREGDTSPSSAWTECRMNGLGVFASRGLRGPLFVEAGLDAYTSADFPTEAPAGDLPVDRMSGLVSVAAGARAQLAPWLRGFVQLGAGVELTRVSVPYEAQKIRTSKVLPEGFFGVGLDLRIARGTYLGATLRTHVMGNFDYDPARLQGTWTMPEADTVFDASPDLAAQGQFFVRHEL
jgi:hypothetical protein